MPSDSLYAEMGERGGGGGGGGGKKRGINVCCMLSSVPSNSLCREGGGLNVCIVCYHLYHQIVYTDRKGER